MKLIPVGKPARRAIEEYGDRVPGKIRGRVISLDTETTGLDPYQGARIFCYGYTTNEGERGQLPKTPATTAWIIKLLEDRRNKVIFQGGKFDLKMLTFEGFDPDRMKARYHDTLAMSKLLYELGGHSLDEIVKRHLGTEVKTKQSVHAWLSKERKRRLRKILGREPNFSDVPWKIMRRYLQWDTDSPLRLYYLFKKPIKRDYWKIYRNECKLIFCTLDMERRGVLLDMDRVAKLKARATRDLKRLEKRVGKIAGKDFVLKGKGSRKGLIALLKRWKWNPQMTDKGNPQLDEYGMMTFMDEALHPLIRDKDEWSTSKFVREMRKIIRKNGLSRRQLFPGLLMKWRELDKMKKTYYTAFQDKAIPLKKASRNVAVLHGRFNSLAAITGRFSSSGPNLQNIPRILGPRQCFATRKGYINYYFDYSQVEIRLFVHYAHDKKLKKVLLSPGGDVHATTAADIFDKLPSKLTKEERKKGKQINFGILYGSGIKRLAKELTKKGIPTTYEQAKRYMERYHAKYPLVRRLMFKCKTGLQRKGYVENEYGRRAHVPLKAAYKSLNALIQGCAADVMKFALIRVWEYIKEHGLKSRIIMTIHDELVIEIHKSEVKTLVPKIVELMEQDSPMFYVPLKVDVEKTSGYWSDKAA